MMEAVRAVAEGESVRHPCSSLRGLVVAWARRHVVARALIAFNSSGLYVFSLSCVITMLTAAATKTKPIGDDDDRRFTIIVKRRRRSVCRRRWPSFATLPTDCYWGVNASVPYCGCILIPLLPVVGRSVGNKGCRALGGSLQKDNGTLNGQNTSSMIY